jgi:hypothetical protein
MGVDLGYGRSAIRGILSGGARIKGLAACTSEPARLPWSGGIGRGGRRIGLPCKAGFRPDRRGIRQLRRLREYNCRSGQHVGDGRGEGARSPAYLTYLPTTRWIFDHSLRGSVNSDFCPLGGFHWATYQAVSVQRSRCLMVDLVSPSASR